MDYRVEIAVDGLFNVVNNTTRQIVKTGTHREVEDFLDWEENRERIERSRQKWRELWRRLRRLVAA